MLFTADGAIQTNLKKLLAPALISLLTLLITPSAGAQLCDSAATGFDPDSSTIPGSLNCSMLSDN